MENRIMYSCIVKPRWGKATQKDLIIFEMYNDAYMGHGWKYVGDIPKKYIKDISRKFKVRYSQYTSDSCRCACGGEYELDDHYRKDLMGTIICSRCNRRDELWQILKPTWRIE